MTPKDCNGIEYRVGDIIRPIQPSPEQISNDTRYRVVLLDNIIFVANTADESNNGIILQNELNMFEIINITDPIRFSRGIPL